MPTPDEDVDRAAADALIEKLRAFTRTLDPAERRLLAALLAPGVDAAWTDDEEAEVSGFSAGWSPARLPEHLVEAVRTRPLRVEGL